MNRRATTRSRANKLLENLPIHWPKKPALTFEEAARVLNWSRQSVYHAALRTGEIKFREVNGRYMICTADLLNFMNQIIDDELAELEREERASETENQTASGE